MEKYARQAVSEGVKTVEDIHVSMDSEIYRVLNLHYNRNNHIEVWGPQVRIDNVSAIDQPESIDLPNPFSNVSHRRSRRISGSSWSRPCASFSRPSKQAKTRNNHGRNPSTRSFRGLMTPCRITSNPPTSWSNSSKPSVLIVHFGDTRGHKPIRPHLLARAQN